MMLKKHVLTGALAMALSLPVVAQERVAIGTGGTGGVFYAVGAGMADLINRKLEGVTANAEVTGASIENIRRVSMGEMTIGFSSASTLYAGSKGEYPFKSPQKVAAIAYLYPATLQIAATKSSGVASVGDLSDVRLSVGPPGSNSSVISERLLKAYNAYNEKSVQFLSYGEATGAIKDGNLDASMILAGVPASAFIELTTTQDVSIVAVDPQKVQGLLKDFPFYRLVEIPAGIYNGQPEAVAALGDPAILFTSSDADEELVYNLTKVLFDNLDELGAVHPAAKKINLQTAPDAPIALHPGAKRYFSN